MNKISILILFFILFNVYKSFSQINPNSPIEGFNNTHLSKEITIKLTEKLPNDSLKVLAIYDWIIENITYDTLLFKQIQNPSYWNKFESSNLPNKTIFFYDCAEILSKKKTIDLGYAHLFSSMCNHIGIKNAIVKGYGRADSVAINVPNHAWVAFKLYDNWYLADPTWDSDIYTSGYKSKDNRKHVFLMDDPKLFLTTHFPIDPLWQLRSSILSLKDWKAFVYNVTPTNTYCNYVDSLKNYSNNDIEKNFLRSLDRIIQAKEHSFFAHYEYCAFLSKQLNEEMAYYTNLNRQLNSGNKNIEEMARKILPRKKELFDRLTSIESYVTKYNHHLKRLTEVQNQSENYSRMNNFISSELEMSKQASAFVSYEKNSLKETIKELEPYQKKTTTKK